jgi:hypothetical protein
MQAFCPSGICAEYESCSTQSGSGRQLITPDAAVRAMFSYFTRIILKKQLAWDSVDEHRIWGGS